MLIRESNLIPTGSYSLDRYLFGWMEGSVVEIGGDVQTGKSLLALATIAQQAKLGNWSLYIDLERRLDRDIVERSGAIRNLIICHPETNEVETVIRNLAPYCKVIVVDSSHLAPNLPRQMREIRYLLAECGTVMLVLSQMRQAMTVSYTSGGADLRAWPDDRILLRSGEAVKDGYRTIGRLVEFQITKCRRAKRTAEWPAGHYLIRNRWWPEMEQAYYLMCSNSGVHGRRWRLEYDGRHFHGAVSLARYLESSKRPYGEEFDNNLPERC